MATFYGYKETPAASTTAMLLTWLTSLTRAILSVCKNFKKSFPDAKPYPLQKDSLDHLKASWNTELNLLKKFYLLTILLVQHTKPTKKLRGKLIEYLATGCPTF